MDTQNKQKLQEAYNRFYQTIQTLRSPEGCPWDKDQTPLSMRRDLIEETFEAVDAITQEDHAHAKEELGDVMLNATMIAYMFEQQGIFSVADTLTDVTDKLIRRHPHVFTQSEGKSAVTGEVKTGDEVISQWERIKQTVEGRACAKTILDEVPQGFPPLLKAYKMQKKASKLGFDWPTLEPVIAKISEELEEVQEAYDAVTRTVPDRTDTTGTTAAPFTVKAQDAGKKEQLHLEEECGDLLFAVINYLRHLGVDPEIAMDRANKKFYQRFSYIEQHMKEQHIPQDSAHLAEQEKLWEEAKTSEIL
ncbi:MAG: nucleoside triphosphate pyrophosphohydrolase [Treponema sp.]|nr:nucleoside triphosphate pyrophosphohydrolase [Treponema sp.]